MLVSHVLSKTNTIKSERAARLNITTENIKKINLRNNGTNVEKKTFVAAIYGHYLDHCLDSNVR